MGDTKYRLLQFGMHLLPLANEYSLAVEQGLRIYTWMYGTKAELLATESEQAKVVKADGRPIEVVSEGQVQFRIEV